MELTARSTKSNAYSGSKTIIYSPSLVVWYNGIVCTYSNGESFYRYYCRSSDLIGGSIQFIN